MSKAKRARVLIVDADSANLETLCLLLQSHGHDCTRAATASAALAHCLREQFDCMLVHASLGGTSGIALADRLSHEPQARPPHIVLMSGRPKADFNHQLREGVVDAFLRKPAGVDELLAVVSRGQPL